MMDVAIKSLSVGDRFRFPREVTVWEVESRTSEGGLTALTIHDAAEPSARSRFVRPSLTYVTKIG